MFSIIAKCFSSLAKKETRDIKILMLGLDNAGKSTIMNDLKGDSRETTIPTIGFSTADLRMLDFKIKAFDVGGGPQIRGIWKEYYAEIFGVVYVIDASDHDRLAESKTVLRDAISDPRLAGKPFVLFANKQDKAGAFSEMEVEHQFEIQQLVAKSKSPCKVFQCTAFLNNGKKVDSQIKKGLTWLLQTLKQDYTTFSERVQKETIVQKEIEKRQKAERLERLRKVREERERAEREAEKNAVEESNRESDDDDVVFGNVLPKVKHVTKGKKKRNRKSRDEEDLEQNKDNVNEIVETPRTEEPDPKDRHSKTVLDSNVNEQCNGEVKKRKKKKRKIKRNKTAPAPIGDEEDSDSGVVLKPLAWNTQPRNLNGFAGKSRMLEPIRPPLHNSLYSPSRTSTITEEDEEGKPNDFILVSRLRPNSEGSEVMT